MSTIIDFAKDTILEINEENRCILNAVQPEMLFHFPQGVPAFEDIKDYVLITNENIRPFMFLQALDQSGLSFVCIDTFLIKPDYDLNIPEATLDIIKLERPDDALILSFVTVKPNVEDITANLMSPVVINIRNKKGHQVIPESVRYPVRYRIWDAIEAKHKMLMVG